MAVVVVYDLKPMMIMDIVKDLRAQGYLQGTDFDYAYYPSEQDTFSHEPPTRRRTVFTFYKEKYATLFALKYGS